MKPSLSTAGPQARPGPETSIYRRAGGSGGQASSAVSPCEPKACQTRFVTIERAYRLRVYPTRAQAAQLARLGGACRWVWNWALARRSEAYKADGTRLNWVALSREFTALRAAPETAWLGDLPREPFKQVLRDQEQAFANFFAKRARYPNFKRRCLQMALRFMLDQRKEQVERGTGRWAWVKLPGLGRVKLRRTEPLVGRLRNVTFSRDAAGHWYACMAADGVPAPEAPTPMLDAVGVDLGVGSVAVLSDGRKFAASRELEAQQRRLRRYQRRFARQRDAAARAAGLDPSKPLPKGTRLDLSNRAKRQQQRIGRLHVRVAATRNDQLHKVSTAIVREAAVIAVEDLNVKALARSGYYRAFRRRFGSAAIGELRRQLDYKGAWHGRAVVEVDRFFPSSKTCSACGHRQAAMPLSVRRWTCPACGTDHDRDVNAAVNLCTEGLRLLASPEGAATAGTAGSHARGVSRALRASSTGGKAGTLKREAARKRSCGCSRATHQCELHMLCV
ncbi:transposase [Salmonella enterica subsp. enterica serovar Muenster]|nr:transposase [Salmonella enterica subsp. enterica serovar Muenster]